MGDSSPTWANMQLQLYMSHWFSPSQPGWQWYSLSQVVYLLVQMLSLLLPFPG
jgi:hypothetical protein